MKHNEAEVYLPLFLIGLVLMWLIVNYRGKFPFGVNCWFCNKWHVVQFSNRNSWLCPICEQYNGFNSEGDYNIEIPAQHVISERPEVEKNCTATNGLCENCNEKQSMKVGKLAKFQPKLAQNYDFEFEIYRKRLENLYGLCKSCTAHVSKTLYHQQSWFLSQNKLRLSKFTAASGEKTMQTSLKGFLVKLVKRCLLVVSLLDFLVITFVVNDVLGVLVECLDPFFQEMADTSVAFQWASDWTDLRLLTVMVLNTGWQIGLAITNGLLALLPLSLTAISCDHAWISSIGLGLQIIGLVLDGTHFPLQTVSCCLWILANCLDEIISTNLHIYQIFLTCTILVSTVPAVLKRQDVDKLKVVPFSTPEHIKYVYSECNNLKGPITPVIQPDVQKNSPGKPLEGKPPIESDTTVKTACPVSMDALENFQSLKIDAQSMLRSSSAKNVPFTCRPYCSTKAGDIFSARPKKVLSPPRLRNIAQASWVAGGYWKSPENRIPSVCPSSRNSSQSSGFCSQSGDQFPLQMYFKAFTPFNSLPPSRDNSICGDYDRISALSEPAYHFKPHQEQLVQPTRRVDQSS